jgi:hypothetical protein
MIDNLIQEYKAKIGNKFITPKKAFGCCIESSNHFAGFAYARGFQAYIYELITEGTFAEPPYDEPGPVIMTGFPGQYMHFATAIEDTIIDWTYRQFDRSCDYPRVVSVDELLTEWEFICITDVNTGKHMTTRPDNKRKGRWANRFNERQRQKRADRRVA